MSTPDLRKNKSGYDTCDSECSSPPDPAPVPPPPSSSPGSHSRTNFFIGLIIAGSVLAFLIICVCLFLVVRRRRNQRRRRREALLEAAMAPAAPAANGGGGGGVDLEEAVQGDDVVHHAWLIRTVGLDEAAIESIALTRYRAGAGAGASDCAVCLGEFADGELLRLLPRCAHAFHVHCIDTWLRAHVNCPLCRSHVLDATDPAAAESDSPLATEDDDTGQTAIETTDHEQLDHQQAREQRELRLQIDHDRHDGRSDSPEQQPSRHPGTRGGNLFRRVASMDSPSAMEAAVEEADDQAGGEKQGTGGAVHFELFSPSSSGSPKNQRGMKRSLSVGSRWALVSRHCRRSSSLLPF